MRKVENSERKHKTLSLSRDKTHSRETKGRGEREKMGDRL